ncbi:hypothetical protein Y032_0258g429 [Ancylostoma ceylanicum]|uniref:Peptidase A1 domain-containing protein n=1 Tax=Ancylostoma ceylanicum TaxID=53326 RepID=A0A016SBM4_9BILA|nr:hypothetical protein Y032_0258g429 [Ancylostoma ceylanicum]
MSPITVALVLAVTTTTLAKIFEMHLERVESVMIQMLRNRRWAGRVRQRRRMTLGNTSTDPFLRSQSLTYYYGSEYLGNITIGTPEQRFQVVVDTGSADFWVTDYSCVGDEPEVCEHSLCDAGLVCVVFCPESTCCTKNDVEGRKNYCKGRRLFDSRKSDTYIKADGTWRIMYGIESVRGFCGNDTVRLGVDSERLIVPGTRFGQANKLSVFFSEKPVDGVLGLAFYLLSATNNVPPFQRAAELGLVDPIFTVYLEKVQQLDGKAHGGLVTYGGFDSQHCSETITYENLTAATYWQFKMKSVTAGDFHAAFPWKAITSTSTSFINAPVIMAEKVAKAVGAVFRLSAFRHCSR